mmetsp:Transcript_21399/g.54660  ORF Transcript_21399/g.54660 Transcript_21399/m.54660 type:complete len:225 (-) Transcript_21399:394-1068(-)
MPPRQHRESRFACRAAVGLVHRLQEAVLQHQHRGQMRACTLAHEHHVLRVATVHVNVLEDPADAPAHVLDHVGNLAPGEVPVIDADGDDTKVHQPQPQLCIVAPVSDNEGSAHDGDHHGHRLAALLRRQRFLRDINVQILALRRTEPHAALDAPIVVVGEEYLEEGRQQHDGVHEKAEAQTNGNDAKLEPPHAAHGKIETVHEDVEAIRDRREIPVAPVLKPIV